MLPATVFPMPGDETEGASDPPRAADAARYDAFMSYARADNTDSTGWFVDRLRVDLQARGHQAWIDVEDIISGTKWHERIARGIEACKAFIFVISPDSVVSEHCLYELEQAVACHKLIIPVLRREVEPAALPAAVAEVEWVLLRSDDEHERGLDKLAEALETDVEWRDQHTRLAGRAREWSDANRDSSYLLRGADLRHAEAWQAQQQEHHEAPTREQAEYITRSRHAANRRSRVLMGTMALGLAIALALAVFALIQRQDAIDSQQAAQSRALAAEATAQLQVSPELAGLLALRAVREGRTPSATLALRQAVGAAQSRRVLHGHRGIITALAFDPSNPDILASAGFDGTVRLWNVSSGRALAVFGTVSGTGQLRTGGPIVGEPSDLAFSPDGRYLAAGLEDGTVHVWGVQSLKPALPVLHVTKKSIPRSVRLGRHELIATTSAGQAIFWSLRNGSVMTVSAQAFSEPQLDFIDFGFPHAGQSNVVEAYDPGTIVLDYRHGQILILGGDHASPVATQFSPDGQRILAAWSDGGAELWTADGHQVARLAAATGFSPYGNARGATSAAYSPDSKLVAVGYASGTAGVFDGHSGRLVNILRWGAGATKVAFTTTGAYLAVGYADGSTRVWNPYTGQQVGLLADDNTAITNVVVNSADTYLATSGGDGAVRVWEPLPGRVIYHTPDFYYPAALVPRGRLFVAQANGTLFLRDAATGRAVKALGRFPGFNFDAPPWFSNNGRIMAVTQGSHTTIVNIDTGRRVPLGHSGFLLKSQPAAFQTASFSPDGTQFAAPVSNGGMTVWNTATGAIAMRLDPPRTAVWQALFSPNGRQIAVGAGDGVTCLVPTRGKGPTLALRGPRATIANPISPTEAVAFNPSGSVVATATAFHGVRLWDTHTGRQVGASLAGYGAFVTFSPNGRQLATSTVGGSAVFPLGRAGVDGPPEQLPGGIATGAVFAPDGMIAVGSLLEGVALYDLRSDTLVERFGAGTYSAGFEYGPQGVLSSASNGSTLYACDACGTVPTLERTAQTLLVRRLTSTEIRRYVNGG
jgi:WD40 repeat protein